MAYTTINKSEDYFNTVLYTGTESSGNSITGVGFQPDFIWIKNRSDVTNHNLYDSVRGGNGTSHYFLKSNVTNAEGTNTSSLLTIDSDGFTLGDGNEVNGTPDNIVAWNWLAGGTASSNTDGDITSSVSVNTTSGFSIVSYTGSGTGGDTIGHGLGVTPKVVIAKGRSDAGTWSVYHEGIGNAANGVSLENSSGTRSEPAYWNSTAPTSSVFSVGTSNDTNASSRTYIAYCFAEKKGFSKFGTYTGNGVASGGGPFIYLGFKPAFFLLKEISGSDNWTLMDNRRLGYNKRNDHLFPNLTNAEYATDRIDMVSNGIKIIDNDGSINQSGSTYIYMAFAEHPFVSSTGTPITAR